LLRFARNDGARFRVQLSNSNADVIPRSRGAIRPSFASFYTLVKRRGRREDRVRAAPAVSCAICTKKCAHEHTGSAESIRPSLRNGFTAYSVLSPVTGFVATVADGYLRQLDASIGASGPHDFAVRLSAVRQWHIRVHRISPHVRDDREPPLLSGETRGERPLICPTRQAEYFLREGWTGFFDLPVEAGQELNCLSTQ
jgi:hypothetical protein